MLELILFVLTSFGVGLSGALVPGPMLTVTVSDSVKKGFLTGPLVVLGHFITELILIIFILAGFSWLVGSAEVAIIIGTLGGIMLIYMGYITSKSTVDLNDVSDTEEPSSKYGSVLKGIVTSVSNPYFFIWWATIGLAFLFKGVEMAGLVGLIGFIIGHWSADLGWFSVVSFFSSKGSTVMSEKQYSLIMKICGLFLIVLGAYFLITAQLNMVNFRLY
ncbi:MAG: LysE family transporter [Methanobacteriaceae archaeon]|jgi:threonine/homoserine/homoserine lactone efflux protein|nr:LysE family transporter [Methanobacteriaceae archaeon]OPY23166.1 MAG: leucine export protein LeuE [Methanobacterium sp. PtaU1.Bin097]